MKESLTKDKKYLKNTKNITDFSYALDYSIKKEFYYFRLWSDYIKNSCINVISFTANLIFNYKKIFYTN